MNINIPTKVDDGSYLISQAQNVEPYHASYGRSHGDDHVPTIQCRFSIILRTS